MYCGAWFKTDNSVRSVYFGYIYPKYVLYGFAFANAFNLYHLLILNGGSLELVILMVHLNKIADSKMIVQVDIFATRFYTFQELNTTPNPPEKFRKQVIKTYSIRDGWWNIGIKGDGGVKSKGARFLIEKGK